MMEIKKSNTFLKKTTITKLTISETNRKEKTEDEDLYLKVSGNGIPTMSGSNIPTLKFLEIFRLCLAAH